ncbi:MAG: vWA domain-containing protein [Hyphomicrobium sp.]|jgi:mxaC protein
MNLAVSTPWLLAIVPLIVLPLFSLIHRAQGHPSLADCPRDALSAGIAWALRLLGAVAIGGLLLGMAGVHQKGEAIEKTGEGAHIVLLIDRSSSMDNTFAGQSPEGGEESKSAAARRLLKSFVLGRTHDLVGVAAFSTSPMHVLPLTDHKDAVLAAVDAIDRPGLALTNVGRGLALALDIQEADTSAAPRVIVLVSDGAAVIDRKVQERLRAAFVKRPVDLYWLFLRTQGSPGISDRPQPDEPDTPQAYPERHLDIFFKSLAIPYRAFEAETPEAVENAIGVIGKLERSPITYSERIPQKDLAGAAYGSALFALVLLLAAKLAEAQLIRTGVAE